MILECCLPENVNVDGKAVLQGRKSFPPSNHLHTHTHFLEQCRDVSYPRTLFSFFQGHFDTLGQNKVRAQLAILQLEVDRSTFCTPAPFVFIVLDNFVVY